MESGLSHYGHRRTGASWLSGDGMGRAEKMERGIYGHNASARNAA